MRLPHQSRLLETLAAITAFVAGVVVAVTFSLSWPARGIHPNFYQSEFASAAMLACGRGYVVPFAPLDAPALADFLGQKSQSLDCSSIPDIRTKEPGVFQLGQLYLIGSVGVLWKVTGVGWDRLSPLYGLLYGLYALAAYGLFRLGVGRVLALATTFLLITSRLQLENLPHLRDFAKAPFILTVVLLMAWLVKHTLPVRSYLALAALTGAVLGIGVGFRMDLFILLPPALVAIFLFTPGRVLGNIRNKASAAALLFASFLITASPVLYAFRGGGNTFHVILLGLMSPFDAALEVRPALYEWGFLYDDRHLHTTLESYAHRLEGTEALPFASREYEHAGLSYYLSIVFNFPADIALRYLAAVRGTLALADPSLLPSGLPPFAYLPFEKASAITPLPVIVALVMVFAARPRLGLFSAMMILYLAGIPSLQFHGRHVFHLQFLPLWALAFLVHQLLAATFAWCRRRGGRTVLSTRPGDTTSAGVLCARGALFLGVATAVLAGSLWGLRSWQQAHLVKFLGTYERAWTQSIPSNFSIDASGDARFLLTDHSAAPPGSRFPLVTRYWVAEFDGLLCEQDLIPLKISYSASDVLTNASRTISLRIYPSARYFFPTYSLAGQQVEVGLAEEDAVCLTRIREVARIADFPLLLSLSFRPGWQEQRLYQQLVSEPFPQPVRQIVPLFVSPDGLRVNRAAVRAALRRIADVPLEAAPFRAAVVVKAGSGFRVNAMVDTPFEYLLQLPPRSVEDAAFLVAEGEILEGGITIGLLKDGQWSGQINVTEPGTFLAVIRAEAGVHVATLANNVPGRGKTHFKLNKFGWVDSLRSR